MSVPTRGAARLIAGWLRDLADKVERGDANLPELYDELAVFSNQHDLREQLPEYADITAPVNAQFAVEQSQPACGTMTPHKAHNGFATTGGMPWCTGVNGEGSGPDWTGE